MPRCCTFERSCAFALFQLKVSGTAGSNSLLLVIKEQAEAGDAKAASRHETLDKRCIARFRDQPLRAPCTIWRDCLRNNACSQRCFCSSVSGTRVGTSTGLRPASTATIVK